MLILTGATGNLGSRVLAYLLTRNLIPDADLTICTSGSPDKLPAVAASHNVAIRTADFTTRDIQALADSFRGADALFLVSFPSPSVERWNYHRNAIDAAREAGVKVVIYTSLMFGGETGMKSVCGVQQAHIKTVEYLMNVKERSGDGQFDFVVIREGIYAESWWLYSGFQPTRFKAFEKVSVGEGGKGSDQGREEEVGGGGEGREIDFVVPDDGPIAWVTWEDLAEGTAKILANYKNYLGQTLNFTGPRTTTIRKVAELVERETGRKVNVKIVGKGEARRYHVEERKSLPAGSEWVIESWCGWFDGIRDGEAAVVDPFLAQLLGRQPRGIEEMARELFGDQND